MKYRFILLGLLFSVRSIFAQDTITVMQYNLLYYGEITGFCNNSNNSLQYKDPYFKTILNHVKPDILTVNELSQNESIHQHLLDNVLNINGVTHFQRAQRRNAANSNIVNQIYFDARKLKLKAQYTAQTHVRDVDVYELYYNSNDLHLGDTAFIVCVVAHLKAGNTSGDANSRKIMTENTMRFLETRWTDHNVLFMGDFNFYTGFEPGFQTMINYSNPNMRFIDPIGQTGDWNNNSFYAPIHTQSTHTSSNNCKSGGGLDDRFDFILISDEVRFGTRNVRYIQSSYKAIGQDGLRFDGTINGPPQNAVVPQDVADALFHMSDHLPVTLKLRVDKVIGLDEKNTNPFMAEIAPNPALQYTRLSFYQTYAENISIEIIDLKGIVVGTSSWWKSPGKHQIEIETASLKPGVYLLRIQSASGKHQSLRLLKK